MSKKMPEHHRLFKLWKAGFFDKIAMTEEQFQLLKRHYPFICGEESDEEQPEPSHEGLAAI